MIWREVMLTREKKPVIASMSDVAASGGYYIAMPAHAIVAQPATLTGSIGVVFVRFVIKGTLDKLGLNMETVKAGRYADLFSPVRPFSPDEKKKLSELMQATYDGFVEKAAAGRNTTPERIDAVAQGRVWTGKQAKEIGLVDELGGLDALALAKQHAKIAATSEVGWWSIRRRNRSSKSSRSPGRSDQRAAPRRGRSATQRPRARDGHGAAASVPPRRALAIMPSVFVTDAGRDLRQHLRVKADVMRPGLWSCRRRRSWRCWLSNSVFTVSRPFLSRRRSGSVSPRPSRSPRVSVTIGSLTPPLSSANAAVSTAGLTPTSGRPCLAPGRSSWPEAG